MEPPEVLDALVTGVIEKIPGDCSIVVSLLLRYAELAGSHPLSPCSAVSRYGAKFHLPTATFTLWVADAHLGYCMIEEHGKGLVGYAFQVAPQCGLMVVKSQASQGLKQALRELLTPCSCVAGHLFLAGTVHSVLSQPLPCRCSCSTLKSIEQSISVTHTCPLTKLATITEPSLDTVTAYCYLLAHARWRSYSPPRLQSFLDNSVASTT